MEWIHDKYGIDCGCEGRRQRLNQLWNFRRAKPEDMTEEEHQTLIATLEVDQDAAEAFSKLRSASLTLKPVNLPTNEMLEKLVQVAKYYDNGSQPAHLTKMLYEIHNYVFDTKTKVKSCSSCNRNIFNRMAPFLRLYKNTQNS